MTRSFLMTALAISTWATSHAQIDTMWIVSGGVSLGGDTLAALSFVILQSFKSKTKS
ncbi:MAG: hypothetical protein O3B70_08860 [Bacteroidetes bacterium]|nr:hypothetical protein [Bacteroidota bacterium]MDA0904433.1 hypothetical protein [Bacteroidota bacterium]MDA1243263.1 hypothetical protein [Bacteroidota bacterium]